MIRCPQRGSLSASSLIGDRVTGRGLFMASPNLLWAEGPPGWHIPVSSGATFPWEHAADPPEAGFWGETSSCCPASCPLPAGSDAECSGLLLPARAGCQQTAASLAGAKPRFWCDPGQTTWGPGWAWPRWDGWLSPARGQGHTSTRDRPLTPPAQRSGTNRGRRVPLLTRLNTCTVPQC